MSLVRKTKSLVNILYFAVNTALYLVGNFKIYYFKIKIKYILHSKIVHGR